MAFEKKEIHKAIKNDKYFWRKHVLERLAERSIRQTDVIDVILNGECIEEYPNDKPFPSALYLGWIEDKPLHVVFSINVKENLIYIITTYIPDLEHFERDYRTRRNLN